jgi:hypothetical protein
MRLEGNGGVYDRPSRDERDDLFGSEPAVQWLERKYPPGMREPESGSTLMFLGMGVLGVATLGATVAPVLAAELAKGAGAVAINQIGALGTNALSDIAAAGVGHQVAKRKYRKDASTFGRRQVQEIVINRDRYLQDKLDQQSARSAELEPDVLLRLDLGNKSAEFKVGRKRPK